MIIPKIKCFFHCLIFLHKKEQFSSITKGWGREIVYIRCFTCKKIFYKNKIRLAEIENFYGTKIL